MIVLLKIALGFCLLSIFVQDIKERRVYVFLYLTCGLIMSYLHFTHSISSSQYFVSIGLNLFVLAIIMIVLTLYSRWKLKKPLKETFGSGDFLFFVVVALGFSTTSFLVLFSFSLLFTGITYRLMLPKLVCATVPLAGLQALFFCILLVSNWLFSYVDFYKI